MDHLLVACTSLGFLLYPVLVCWVQSVCRTQMLCRMVMLHPQSVKSAFKQNALGCAELH